MGSMYKFDGGTLMGADLVIFGLWGEHHPNRAIMENPLAPKFSRPIRLLDSSTQNFSRKTYLQNSFFVWQFFGGEWPIGLRHYD